MEKYSTRIQIRWADIDQNRHMRHSVYYDYGAMVRINFLGQHGLTSAKFEELNIGPILFREECIFRREISLEDEIDIDLELIKSTADYSRWSIRHRFIKSDGVLAATLSLDGAWIDIQKRKLTAPSTLVRHVFSAMPKSADFELTPAKTAGTTS